jgi:hypothetical protein
MSFLHIHTFSEVPNEAITPTHDLVSHPYRYRQFRLFCLQRADANDGTCGSPIADGSRAGVAHQYIDPRTH